jgi:hypothetical protein
MGGWVGPRSVYRERRKKQEGRGRKEKKEAGKEMKEQ